MIISLCFELLLIIYGVLSICADSLLSSATLWLSEHWLIVQICVYLSFLLVVVSELSIAGKKIPRKLIGQFAFWNLTRSFIAAQYALFLISDITFNYESLRFGEKFLSILGFQIALIPLFAYILFEVVIDKMGGISKKSVTFGGLLSIGGILGLGALIFAL